MDAFDDIRNQLRRDHESSLAELDDLSAEVDDHCCRWRLERVLRSWKACRPRSIEWHDRVSGLRARIARHIEAEHGESFARLAEPFDSEELCDMGSRFLLARDKLTMLESAKAA